MTRTRAMRRVAALVLLPLLVSAALADMFLVMLPVLSFGSEPRWLAPWARFAWPVAHVVILLSVMAWQFLPERWKP